MASDYWKTSPFGENSIFHPSWEEKEKERQVNLASKNASAFSGKVQYYTHPDKKQFDIQKNKAKEQHKKTYDEYTTYYKRIGKISDSSSEEDIYRCFSPANKAELQRLNELIDKNQSLYDNAVLIESKWNKFDNDIAEISVSFSDMKKLSASERLDPNLLKALIFSETEMGTNAEYLELVKNIPQKHPECIYQLNIGRVTNADVFNSVVKEYNIPINWKTNYLALGNRNDIMLAAGALIQKLEYSKKITSPYFKKETPWYNAIVAYKGVSNEGMKKANLVWSLYQTGKHPYSPSKNLF